MNIFILSKDPKEAARIQIECAGHANYKLILESAQMLSTALRHFGYQASDVYEAAYPNHRCNVWVRQSDLNAKWLIEMSLEMARLYQVRERKTYKSERIIRRCAELLFWWPQGQLTSPALAVNSTQYGIDAQRIYRDKLGTWDGAVLVYRYFYFNSKEYLTHCVLPT